MPGFTVHCPGPCSLGPNSKWGQRVGEMLAEKMPYQKILEHMRREDGTKMSAMLLTRHKRHLQFDDDVKVAEDEPEGPELSNIEILQAIIQKGAKNSKNWKPTIGDTMKAMDMWFRLTAGNPFESLLDAMAAATVGEDEDEPPEANSLAVSHSDESEDLIDPEG